MQLVQKPYFDPRDQAVVDPVDPYPETVATITAAYRDNCDRRDAAGIPRLPAPRMVEETPTSDACERLDQHEAIRRLADRMGGWQRLYTHVRNLAHFDGQEVR